MVVLTDASQNGRHLASFTLGSPNLSNSRVMASGILRRLKAGRNVTRPATPLSPQDKVIQTYELLEQILHHLDSHSLRLAQLVSKYWHGIIHKSSILKRRLSETPGLRAVRTLLISAPGVGVDSLATCFIHGLEGFPYGYDPSPGAFFRAQIFVDDERWLIEAVSDTHLDPDLFPNHLGHALANCDTYMLFYAIDSRASFEGVKRFLRQMESPTEPLSTMVETRQKRKSRKDADGKCFLTGLVSTKDDIATSQKVVQSSEGEALAWELGCPFVETSAKTGSGVSDAFAEMCRMYKRVWKEQRRQQSKRTSLVKAVVSPSPSTADAKERKERWWRWYRGKHSEH